MPPQTIELDFPEAIINYPVLPSSSPRLLWKLVYDLLPICDMLTEKGSEIAESFNKKVSCKAGCGVCCQQMVPLSPPEAAIIVDVVNNLPKKRKKKVLNTFTRGVEKLNSNGLLEPLLDIYRSGADRQTVYDCNLRYFELSIYCPFLVEGSCSIYPHRPSRCREYSVLSSSDYCADPFDERIRQLPLTIKLCESFSMVWSVLADKPPVIIPMIYALEWVHENPGIKTLYIPKNEVEKMERKILEKACERANKIARERAGNIPQIQ